MRCLSLTTRAVGGLQHAVAIPGSGLARIKLAEEEGFEPPSRGNREAVFKTAAFNHSATPPHQQPSSLAGWSTVRQPSCPQTDDLAEISWAARSGMTEAPSLPEGNPRTRSAVPE